MPKANPKVRTRFDGELYTRPSPNPFSINWLDGFTTGYDNQPIKPGIDKEWRDGFYTGHEQRAFDREEMNSVSSSNV